MASIATTTTGDIPAAVRSGPGPAGKYPPLIVLFLALFIALAVLPSALNLPQSNPSQTLEYAPVPPDDETPPDAPPGNANEFGLGGSSTLEGEGALGGDDGVGGEEEEPPPPPDEDPAGQGRTPRTKRCVGNPPRQTEDPNSPPCVANFDGDNFGSTYLGVTRDEIRVLFYAQGNTRNVTSCRDPNQVTPNNEYFDLDEPEQPGEHCVVRVVRNMFKYFNERYQTYGRHVHGYVYYSAAGTTPEGRKGDATDNYSQVKPFATISTAEYLGEHYIEALSRKGVLNFGSVTGRFESFFQQNKPKVWSYSPSLEKQAEIFTTYICTKVKGFPTSFGGNGTPDGQPRKYGLWYTRDNIHPELVALGERVRDRLKECGVEMVATGRFPYAGWVQDSRVTGKAAQEAVAEFRSKGVTTVIWPAGLETNFSKQALAVGYFPEMVVLGDRILETDNAAGYQAGAVWQNARIISNTTYRPSLDEEACAVAYREADPSADRTEVEVQACPIYNDFRHLFTAIQVAGPRLGPTKIEQGFRAIPKAPSDNYRVAACYYEPGDYTCVKDAFVERWNPALDNGDGCYQATERGRRYVAGGWPAGNVDAQERPDDPCNAYDDANYSNPQAAPDPQNPE